MFKKFLALTAVCALCFCMMTACTADDGANDNTNPGTTQDSNGTGTEDDLDNATGTTTGDHIDDTVPNNTTTVAP